LIIDKKKDVQMPLKRQFDKIYVLDTNIILNDARNMFKISQGGKNLIVLPETTLDEIDSKKSGFDEINFQAREFGRMLSGATILETKKIDGITITTVSLDNEKQQLVDIISKEKYDIDRDTEKNILNDRKILSIANDCKGLYREDVLQENIIFLSMDVMARTRAISYNLNTEPLLEKDVNVAETEYIKVFEIESHLLNTLSGKPIEQVDPDYKVENYSYHFKCPDGNSMLANIENGLIQMIDEDELRQGEIKPKNLEQIFAMDALLNRNYNVVLIEALAGSGKTLISIASAIRLLRKNSPYDKITYIRNSIESLDKGEEVGFLSGNEEKFKVYTYPLYDTLAMVVRAKKPKATLEEEQDGVQELISRNNIETPWVGEIRGRTITNSVVIIDEAQNMSKKTMQTVISRLDQNCKLIIIGSNKQIDNQYINKYTNGLSKIIKASTESQTEVKMFATSLKKVVRGQITAWAESLFTK
jgi:PhoH-like ATPase